MNKVVVIVGASSGIGLEISKLFIINGFTVYNLSRSKSLIDGINNITADVVNDQTVRDAYQEIKSKHRKIDYLIYCAGCSLASGLEHIDSQDYKYLWEVNYFGAIKIVKTFLPLLTVGSKLDLYELRSACRLSRVSELHSCGGSPTAVRLISNFEPTATVVFVSSVAALFPIPFDGYYSASKSALNMLSQSLNLEYRNHNIRFTSVMPGGVKTNFTFKRKINSATDCKSFENAVNTLKNIEQGGMDAAQCAKKVVKVINKKNPPISAVIGIKNKINMLILKLLPKKLRLKLIAKKFGVP